MAHLSTRNRNSARSMFESSDWDAVFKVEVNGDVHAVFATYEGGGDYQQWGAERAALSANVPTVTAWALARYEETGV